MVKVTRHNLAAVSDGMGGMGSVTHLPKYGRFRPEHELDILAHVPVAVYPHESDQFPETGPEDGEPCAVGVHQIEDVLPRSGDARQSQEVTAYARDRGDLDLQEYSCSIDQ